VFLYRNFAFLGWKLLCVFKNLAFLIEICHVFSNFWVFRQKFVAYIQIFCFFALNFIWIQKFLLFWSKFVSYIQKFSLFASNFHFSTLLYVPKHRIDQFWANFTYSRVLLSKFRIHGFFIPFQIVINHGRGCRLE
jgi:hypothetical protein